MPRSKPTVWIINVSIISKHKSLHTMIEIRSSTDALRFSTRTGSRALSKAGLLSDVKRLFPKDQAKVQPLIAQILSLIKRARAGDWIVLCNGSRTISSVGKIRRKPTGTTGKVNISTRWLRNSNFSGLKRTVASPRTLVEPLTSVRAITERMQPTLHRLPADFLGIGRKQYRTPTTFRVAVEERKAKPAKAGPTLRTIRRGVTGKKLYAVLSTQGRFVDIQTYKRARPFAMRPKSKKVQGKRKFKAKSKAMAPPSSPLEDQGAVVDLLFATNRTNSGESDLNDRYTSEYGDLRYGVCSVSIPPGHVRGEVERPKWWKLQFHESRERDVMLLELAELDPETFFAKWSEWLGAKETKEALLFIHGYNVKFNECAWRTAQIVHDISFPGVASFYSWPSAGDVVGYVHDLQMATLCIPHLQTYIKGILSTEGISKLHIIAHSMGTYILASSLKRLADDAQIQEQLKIIHQVILCAPDIDRKEFEQQIYPQFRKVGDRRTLYASDNDKALKASEAIRKGLPRLGEAGDHLFVAEAIDTIDATSVPTDMLGHGYFAATKDLINDIFHVVAHGDEPADRNLRPQTLTGGLKYWLFPE